MFGGVGADMKYESTKALHWLWIGSYILPGYGLYSQLSKYTTL